MSYQKPCISSFSPQISQMSSQYQIIVTQEGCPTLINPNVTFSSEGFLICGDASQLPTSNDAANITYVITCTNISGSFDALFLFNQAHVSSGLNCANGLTTIAVPIEISPALSEDCILDSFNSGNGNTCDL